MPRMLATLLLAGCYKNAGPVVTDIRRGTDGSLHFVKCDLIVGQSLFSIGRDETGKDAPSPTPTQDKQLEVPVTTRDAGGAGEKRP